MWNFGYHFARAKSGAWRKKYREHLSAIVARPVTAAQSLALDVFSYSNEADLPEQIASIRSFVQHAGRPVAFHVVSDGTHSVASLSLLEQADQSVRVISMENFQCADAPATMRPYLTAHPTGKQMALIMSLPFERPALYLDADVLFFRGASTITRELAVRDVPVFYLADCQFSGDRRLLASDDETRHPINTGVLLFHSRPDWSLAHERFARITTDPIFFSNQTLTHLALHQNNARAFDPARYVLQLDDQTEYRDRYAGDDLVLRHYVNPVRHKFWLAHPR
ncbi:MAG: hypothetical protein M3R59_02780 [Verrucomicrobiota bacterium]|nr:hypothetical protein [Verrucomicrobiota bacterium]